MELGLIPSPGATRAVLTPDDRLSLTICLALIFHALVILGIVFTPEDKANPRYEFMEIVLVQRSSEPDEDADVLAQSNLRGGRAGAGRVNPGIAFACFAQPGPT